MNLIFWIKAICIRWQLSS